MLNTQPIEAPDWREDGSVDFHSAFETIQGEGPLVGTPAVFVRLAGCNLQCPACFHGNTLIKMADYSTKRISKVRAGDKVLSYDETTHKFVPKLVFKSMRHNVLEVYRLNTGGPATFVTGEHPFLVRDKGWIEAKNLLPGDHILNLSPSELKKLNNPMHNKKSVEKMKLTAKRNGTAVGPWARMNKKAKKKWKKKVKKRMTEHNPMKDPEIAIKGFLNRKDRGKMSSVEKFVSKVAKDFDLNFVGGGDLVIGCRVPDFIIKGTNKLIEVWDESQTDYLQRDEAWKKERRSIFEKEGYEVLFLPVTPLPLGNSVGSRKPEKKKQRDAEVSRVQKVIGEYAHNGRVVKSIEKVTPEENPKAWARLTGALYKSLKVHNLEIDHTHTYIANSMIVHNCDTDYTSQRRRLSPSEVVVVVKGIRPSGLIVLTGGEPFRQHLIPLINALIGAGYQVQIETNGIAFEDGFLWGVNLLIDNANLTIVCCPKTAKVHPKLIPYINAWKYIVEFTKISKEDGLPLRSLGYEFKPARPPEDFPKDKIFIQPLDNQDEDYNEQNRDAAIDSCLKYGYRLSLQTHKLLNLP